MPRRVKSAASDEHAPSDSDLAASALADALQLIRDCMDSVRKMLDEVKESDAKYNVQLSSHLMWLAGEMTKVIERERKNADRITVQTIMARLRTMTKDERAHVARELERMMTGGRLFGT
jgi:hypothetical protein